MPGYGLTRSGRRYKVSARYSGPYTRTRVVRRNNNQRTATIPLLTSGVSSALRSRVRSGLGVTDNYDRKQVYRKRRMPRYRRRRWKRFVRRVHAVSEKELGSRTVVFNKSATFSNTNADQQTVGYCYLYSYAGGGSGNDTMSNDLYAMSTMENELDPTLALGATVDNSTKWLFQSAVLDVTVRNTSTFQVTEGNFVPDSLAKLELDIYELQVKIDADDANAAFTSIFDLLNNNETYTRALDAVGPEITIRLRGATPFDLTYVLSRWRMRIWKKTKYILNNGDCITYQVRDPKRRSINRRDMENGRGFNKAGMTRILLFIAKLVPGVTVGNAVGTFREGFTLGVTRKYLYKVEGLNDDRTRYVINT